MDNLFTQRVTDIIKYSREEAIRLYNSYIGSEHLLLGLIREGEGKAFESFLNMQINPTLLKKDIEEEIRQEEMSTESSNINFNEEETEAETLRLSWNKLLGSVITGWWSRNGLGKYRTQETNQTQRQRALAGGP